MPEGRFLSKSIAYSAQVGSVSLEADYLFMRMIPHLDSKGRVVGEPASVKALVCPLRHEITTERTAILLQELHDAGLIVWYESGGQRYAAFPGFEGHQRGARLDREGASRLPGPPRTKAAQLRRTPENSGERRVSEVKRSEVKQSEESAPKAARVTWLTPIAAAWEASKGAGSFRPAKAAGLLKGLRDAGHTPEDIATRLALYLKRLNDPKYASIARFAETYADHVPLKLTQPLIVDGWFSPELEALTRPAGLMA